MRASEYQKEAMRTTAGMRAVADARDVDQTDNLLLNGVMGLCGESGECIDLVKKHMHQGHRLDKAHLAKELGDVAWYLAVTAYAIGYDLDDIFEMNVEKLRERYPDGFEVRRSVHRKDGDI